MKTRRILGAALTLLAALWISSSVFPATQKQISDSEKSGSAERLTTGTCDTKFPEGVLRNLCYAYCRGMGCGDPIPRASAQACQVVRQNFLRLSHGIQLPCPDRDEDGVMDGSDNCPDLYNPDQAASDADSFGDACDNCPSVFNPDQYDRDEDHLGDDCDPVMNLIITNFRLSKQRRHAECAQVIPLCCVDPPLCSCCCVPDIIETTIEDADMISVTASVRSVPGYPGIQSVNVKFLDDPIQYSPPGTPPIEITFPLFDSGGTPLEFKQIGTQGYPLLSGDGVSGDGTYYRNFYLGLDYNYYAPECLASQDTGNYGGTFARYYPNRLYGDSSSTPEFRFRFEAIDEAGTVTSFPEVPILIERAFHDHSSAFSQQCGPPNGIGGCEPSLP